MNTKFKEHKIKLIKDTAFSTIFSGEQLPKRELKLKGKRDLVLTQMASAEKSSQVELFKKLTNSEGLLIHQKSDKQDNLTVDEAKL